MLPQLDPIIESNPQLSPELDPKTQFNCDTIQLWHHNWTRKYNKTHTDTELDIVQISNNSWKCVHCLKGVRSIRGGKQDHVHTLQITSLKLSQWPKSHLTIRQSMTLGTKLWGLTESISDHKTEYYHLFLAWKLGLTVTGAGELYATTSHCPRMTMRRPYTVCFVLIVFDDFIVYGIFTRVYWWYFDTCYEKILSKTFLKILRFIKLK